MVTLTEYEEISNTVADFIKCHKHKNQIDVEHAVEMYGRPI